MEKSDLTPGSREVWELVISERSRVKHLLADRLNQLDDILQQKRDAGIPLSEKEVTCLRKWTRYLSRPDPMEDKADSKLNCLLKNWEAEAKNETPPYNIEDIDTKASSLFTPNDPQRSLSLLISQHREKRNAARAASNDGASGMALYPELNTRGLTVPKIAAKQRTEENRIRRQLQQQAQVSRRGGSTRGRGRGKGSRGARRSGPVMSRPTRASSEEDTSTRYPGEASSGPEEMEDCGVSSDGEESDNSSDSTDARDSRHKAFSDFVCPTEPMSSFFLVLRALFLQAPQRKLTTAQIEERIREWQEKRRQSTPSQDPLDANWIDWVEDWVDVTQSCLVYLCAESAQFAPFLEHKLRLHLWQWLTDAKQPSEMAEEESVLGNLFTTWMLKEGQKRSHGSPPGKKKVGKKKGSERLGGAGNTSQTPDMDIKEPLERTTWVVKAPTSKDKAEFQIQEKERFEHPWRPFVYRCTGGYRAVVGPLPGVDASYASSTVRSRPRGHTLLVPHRPAVVNLMDIVRDAVARLPNGEGSRIDIVYLATESAYWVPGSSPKQIQACISSALDRLQYESTDPAVRYNFLTRQWIYCHRSWTPAKFEQTHRQRLAVVQAKRDRRSNLTNRATASARRGLSRPSNPSPWPPTPSQSESREDYWSYPGGSQDEDDDDLDFDDESQDEWGEKELPEDNKGRQYYPSDPSEGDDVELDI